MATARDVLAEFQKNPELADMWWRRKLAEDFSLYVRAAWPVAMPGVELIDAPYIDALCLHLQAVTETWEKLQRRPHALPRKTPDVNVRNLLINIPPRSLKSTICSVLWPTWMWTREPGVRLLTSSYGSDLAERDALASRRVILSHWYQRLWGDKVSMASDQNRKDRYSNDRGGYRLALGKHGAATGEGGDILISDDPQHALEAYSPASLQRSLDWFGNVWWNRRNDPKRSCMVVIQQRIHEDDVSGALIGDPSWVHLNLPMEYEGESNPTVLGWSDPRTEEGEFLNPARYGADERMDTIRTAGEMGYATQYQQRPAPKGGAILKDSFWVRYKHQELPFRFDRVAVFADTAEKAKERNDFSAMALWGENTDGWWLLDLVWGKWEFPELEDAAIKAWERWKKLPLGRRPHRFIVEDASSGTQLTQTMKKRTKIPVRPYKTPGDKVQRANLTAAYQMNRKLFIPETDTDGVGAFDVGSWMQEHSLFPNSRHDDRVDTTTMMLHYWEIAPPDDQTPWVLAQAVAHRGRMA